MHFFSSLVNYSSGWFWILPVFSFASLFLWIFILKESKRGLDTVSKVLLFVLILVVHIMEDICFVQDIKVQPAFDFGFIVSILAPVLVFYISLIFIVIFVTFSVLSGFVKPDSIGFLKKALFFNQALQLSYALAYSSISGFFFLTFTSALYMIKASYSPPSNKKVKTE